MAPARHGATHGSLTSSKTMGKATKSGTRPTPAARAGTFRHVQEAKWHTTEYKPPRKISDQELAQARKMFFELDRDASGSIDAEELGFMLKSLGQNPTEEELKDLIVRPTMPSILRLYP